MRKIVLVDENLSDVLEAKSIYWNDDLETIGTFVLKTIKRFAEDDFVELLPQFKDSEDRALGEKLFMGAVQNHDKYMALIENFAIVGFVTPNGGRNNLIFCEVTRSNANWQACKSFFIRDRLYKGK